MSFGKDKWWSPLWIKLWCGNGEWYSPEVEHWKYIASLQTERKLLLVILTNRYWEEINIAEINSCKPGTREMLICASNEPTSGKAAKIAVTPGEVHDNPFSSSKSHLFSAQSKIGKLNGEVGVSPNSASLKSSILALSSANSPGMCDLFGFGVFF